MKYVITGGPGVGKTTALLAIAARGFVVVPEAARSIIAEEQVKPAGILPWTDYAEFQRLVALRQLDLESRVDGLAFLDRGIVDNIAYCRVGGVKAPAELEHADLSGRYARVFLLGPLENYVVDSQRKEDLAKARRLHAEIERAYEDAGYSLVHVPVLPPVERADFILRSVGLR